MNTRRWLSIVPVFASSLTLHSVPLTPLHGRCTIGVSDDGARMHLEVRPEECPESHNCGSRFSNDSLTRFKGITLPDLARNGANLTATLATESGTFTCVGTVRDGELEGKSVFAPDAAFVEKMDRMGYTGLDSEKLMAYTFVGVDSAWVQSIRQTGISGITADNLIAMRIFNISPDYVHSFTSMGYELPDAEKLIALKVHSVNAEEVRQIRGLGYQPTLDELIQIRIFKITPEFIRRMEDHGLRNLTISKLVQIRIFKLDE